MTFFFFIIGFIVFGLLIERISKLTKAHLKRKSKRNGAINKADRLGWFSIVLLLLAATLIAFSFLAPAILTSKVISLDPVSRRYAATAFVR